MVLNGWNVVYRVKFDSDNQNLQDDFDTRAEAMEYAKSHLEEKPVVLGIEVYVDEFDNIIDEESPEVLYSYTEEEVEEEIPEPSPDRLSELEAELHEEREESSEHEDPVEEVSEPSEVSEVAAAVEEPVEVEEEPEEVDPYKFAGNTEVDMEPKSFDPFDCDFSDISEDEERYSDVVDGTMDPVAFLQELADELGIGDQVEVTSVDNEIPEVEPIETISDTEEEFPDYVVDSGASPSAVDFTLGDDLVTDGSVELLISAEVPSEVADKLTDETPVTVEVPVEAETAIASEEQVATEAPCEGECCDPHCDVEEPTKEISKCHVCPTCGKEVCECAKSETLTESQSQEIGDTYKKLSDYYGCDLEELVYGPEGFMKIVYPEGFPDFNGDIIYKEKYWDEFEDWLKKTKGIDLAAVRASKEETSDSNETLTEASEMEKHRAIADKFRASLEVEDSLTEETDIQKLAYNRAVEMANKENKPVIYGTTKNGFTEVSPIVCDNVAKETENLKAKESAFTVLVAYPGKHIQEESLEETVPVDLSDDRTPAEEVSEIELADPVNYKDEVAKEKLLSEAPQSDNTSEFTEYEKEQELRKEIEAELEDDDMSDLELAEAVFEIYNKKHCKK